MSNRRILTILTAEPVTRKSIRTNTNRFYDEEYNRLAQLMKFDITSPDGIAGNGNDSRATEVKTVYATVRYDIENRNGGEVSEEDIDDILDQFHRDTKTVGDIIVNTEICGRNDEGGF